MESYYSGKKVFAKDEMTFGDIFPEKTKFPIFEARVVNNTGAVISLKEITFEVFESKPYDKPFVMVLNYDIGKPGYIYFI